MLVLPRGAALAITLSITVPDETAAAQVNQLVARLWLERSRDGLPGHGRYTGTELEPDLRSWLSLVDAGPRRLARAIADLTLASGGTTTNPDVRRHLGLNRPSQQSGWTKVIERVRSSTGRAPPWRAIDTGRFWRYEMRPAVATAIQRLVEADGGLNRLVHEDAQGGPRGGAPGGYR